MADRIVGIDVHAALVRLPPEVTCAFGRSTELSAFFLAGATGLEPATSGVTGRRSNQLSYAPVKPRISCTSRDR